MANVLGELFGNIAAAIREKTGDTATMKPAQFPEKISAIEVGGGSGGSSFPAGVYWEAENIRCPSNYYQQWFDYAGEIYAAVLPYSGNGGDWIIHKYSNGAWTQVVAQTKLDLGSPDGDVYFVEHDGVLHMLGNDTSAHYVFDGTTISKKQTLPGYCISACVHNGDLLAYVRSTGSIYKWNSATDTWSVVADIDTYTYHQHYIFSANNSLYSVYSKVLYEIVGGATVKITDLPNFLKQMYVDGTKYFYFADANGSFGAEEVHVYNIDSNTDTLLGYAPNSGCGMSFLYSTDGVFRSINGNLGTSAYATTSLIMHIIEATE